MFADHDIREKNSDENFNFDSVVDDNSSVTSQSSNKDIEASRKEFNNAVINTNITSSSLTDIFERTKKSLKKPISSLTLKERILLRLYEKMTSGANEEDSKKISEAYNSQTNVNFKASENSIQDSGSSDLRERIRENQEKLRQLLDRNPFSTENTFEETSEVSTEEDLSDLPFQPGPLRLSVYRSTSVDPKPYDGLRSWSSGVRRRPLSETFALPRNLLASDLSSSSDEEVTDPVPESPLNLSDAESMASGQSSPSMINRRRKIIGMTSSHPKMTSKRDVRPRSLYESAKPRPPSREKEDSNDENGGNRGGFGDKLGRLIGFRRNYKGGKNHKDSKNSYIREYEPVPAAGTWTNVVGSSPTPFTQGNYQPHPPLRSVVSAPAGHPAPLPRKKRTAPMPPTRAPLPPTRAPINEDAKTSNAVTSSCPEATPLSESVQSTITLPLHVTPLSKCPVQSNNDLVESVQLLAPPEPFNEQISRDLTTETSIKPQISESDACLVNSRDIISPEATPTSSSVTPTNASQEMVAHTEPIIILGSVIDSTLPRHKANDISSVVKATPSDNPDMDSIATDTPIVQLMNFILQEVTRRANKLPEKADYQNERTESREFTGNDNDKTGKSFTNTSCSPDVETDHKDEETEEILNVESILITCDDDVNESLEENEQEEMPKTSLVIKDQNELETNANKDKNTTLLSHKDDETMAHSDIIPVIDDAHSDVIPVIDDAFKSSDDEIMAAERRSSVKEKKRKNRKQRRDSAENASSGYSSPGSADESCPVTSPEPMTSPTSLGLPSPTSSYYSTSLSASSSRVSDVSRELSLPMTSSCVTSHDDATNKTVVEEKKDVINEKVDENTKAPTKEAASDINMNIVSASESSEPNETEHKEEENSDVKSDLSQDAKEGNTDNENTDIPRQRSVSMLDVFESSSETTTEPERPVTLRAKPVSRPRAKSEYIPYTGEEEHWSSRVSISMVEKPGDSAKIARPQSVAGLFKVPLNKAKGPSKKKSLAAAQKSRAFAMRAGAQWNKRYSYAEKENYLDGGFNPNPEVTSSNLVSHFVSTQNISTYYDGTDQRIVTPQEILHSKREEFFNAFRNAGSNRGSKQFGGSVQQLPVSSAEFGRISIHKDDTIPEVNEIDTPTKAEKSVVYEDPVAPVVSAEVHSEPVRAPESTEVKNTGIQRQTSSSSSGSSNPPNSLYTGSTWSLSTEMTSQPPPRTRKPSLRRRLQGAFSFQNIRRAISIEKLNEDEKRRSMSHHYLNESGTHDLGARTSATLPATKANDSDVTNDPPRIRKAPSITSIISTVRMRKRRSRMQRDNRNRYTIADPGNDKNYDVTDSKRSTLRPLSLILPHTSSRKKPEEVGNPAFFRPIGRVLQMNPVEGTLLVEMVKPPSGPFGFYIARKKEAGDSGSVYISRLSDSYPDKMFAGLMRTGDEITEVNGTNVEGLTLDQVYDLILDSERTLLKIKPSQVHVV